MTVSATVPRVQYTITSSNVTSLASDPASVTFNVTFKYLATSEVVATKTSSGTDTVLTETTHYTLSAAGASGTFTFTATGAALFAADDLLTFNRKMERTSDTFDQLSDYAQNDALDADTLENNFDKAIMISQQMKEAADRRLHFSATSTFETTGEAAAKITATKADRANKYLSFDANGDITTSTTVEGASYTETSIAAGHILRYSGSAWVNSSILALDDIKLYFGTDSDTSIEWDTTDTALQFQANVEGQPLSIGLYADQGDDNIDKWKLSVADGGVMTFNTKASGSFVPLLTITPHATATSSSVVIAGDLTVDGTTTTVNTANLLVEDPLIVLSKNTSGGSPSNDCGLIIERGDLTNVGMIWDESADEFAFLSSTSEAGSTAGNINMTTFGDVRTGKNYEERSCYKRGFHQSLVFGL